MARENPGTGEAITGAREPAADEALLTGVDALTAFIAAFAKQADHRGAERSPTPRRSA